MVWPTTRHGLFLSAVAAPLGWAWEGWVPMCELPNCPAPARRSLPSGIPESQESKAAHLRPRAWTSHGHGRISWKSVECTARPGSHRTGPRTHASVGRGAGPVAPAAAEPQPAGPSGGQLGLWLSNFGSKFNNSVFSPPLFPESLFFKFPCFFCKLLQTSAHRCCGAFRRNHSLSWLLVSASVLPSRHGHCQGLPVPSPGRA